MSSYRKRLSGDEDTLLTVLIVWPASSAPNSNGDSYFRAVDPEYKMLNYMARMLEPNATLGQTYSTHTGEIVIISEIPYCMS